MKYRAPSISNEVAVQVWNARSTNEEIDLRDGSIDFIGDGEESISDLELEEFLECLDEIQIAHKNKDKKKHGGAIDGAIVRHVHGCLSGMANPYQLSQLGFWRWLSNVASNGYFWRFIMWRLDSQNQVNWGITNQGQIVEVYFYRAWLRGHKMYDESLSNPYEYAEKGSSDFWRSHVFRQDFGKDREFVKAFMDTVYDKDGRTVIGTAELRKVLIPALRAWSSSGSYAHLTYQESLELIDNLRKIST